MLQDVALSWPLTYETTIAVARPVFASDKAHVDPQAVLQLRLEFQEAPEAPCTLRRGVATHVETAEGTKCRANTHIRTPGALVATSAAVRGRTPGDAHGR